MSEGSFVHQILASMCNTLDGHVTMLGAFPPRSALKPETIELLPTLGRLVVRLALATQAIMDHCGLDGRSWLSLAAVELAAVELADAAFGTMAQTPAGTVVREADELEGLVEVAVLPQKSAPMELLEPLRRAQLPGDAADPAERYSSGGLDAFSGRQRMNANEQLYRGGLPLWVVTYRRLADRSIKLGTCYVAAQSAESALRVFNDFVTSSRGYPPYRWCHATLADVEQFPGDEEVLIEGETTPAVPPIPEKPSAPLLL